jgi:hypothetical protein
MYLSKLFYILLFLITLAPTSFAGSITSSGGNILDDSANPWFLENTKDVHYCIEWDRGAFHADESQVRSSIAEAFDFWQRALRENQEDPPFPGQDAEPYGRVRIGTQKFIREEECDDSTELRFQLGVLSPEQAKILADPRKYVGAAVRTSYDRINMRARGFIYLAADMGKLRPDAEIFARRPWEALSGFALKAVLRHEIGHIFGFSHEIGRYLMDSKTPYYLTTEQTLKYLATNPDFLFTTTQLIDPKAIFGFGPISKFEWCTTNPDWNVYVKLFRGPASHNCIRININLTGNAGSVFSRDLEMVVFSKVDGHVDWQEIRTIKTFATRASSKQIVQLKFPIEQKVFTKLPEDVWLDRSLSLLYSYEWEHFRTEFATDRGKTELFLRMLTNNHWEITGTDEDGLFYQPVQ